MLAKTSNHLPRRDKLTSNKEIILFMAKYP